MLRRRPGEAAAWALLLLASAVAHFARLDVKALHHDESLHAYYSWFIAENGTYDYTPMMHGPFQLYATGWTVRLLGDSLAVMRLLAALAGTLLPLFGLALRGSARPGQPVEGLGPLGAWLAGVWLLCSAPLLYYGRFFRNDVPFAALACLGIAAAWHWWRGGGRSVTLAAVAAAALGLLMSIKENALILYFTLFVFIHVFLLLDFARGAWPERQWLRRWLFSSSSLLAGLQAVNIGGAAFIVIFLVARRAFPPQVFTPSAALNLLLLAIALYCVVMAWVFRVLPTLPWRRELHAWRLQRGLRQSWQGFAIGTFAALLIYMTLFTDLLRAPMEPIRIFHETFDYWLKEHQKHRLRGPFHYYLPILAVYHLPAAAVCIAATVRTAFDRKRGTAWIGAAGVVFSAILLVAWFFGWPRLDYARMDGLLHMTSLVHVWLAGVFGGGGLLVAGVYLWRDQALRAFLAAWTILSLLIYSYAGEKIPWVSVHIVVPLLTWAGLETARILRALGARRPRLARRAFAAVAIVLLWSGFNAWRAAFLYPSNPRERLVYNHTSAAFREAALVALRADATAQQEVDRRLRIRYQGASGWPLAFHLRHIPDDGELGNKVDETDIAFIDAPHWMTDPRLQKDFIWLDVPFRQYWTPQMLPFPRMFGWLTWTPDPTTQWTHHFLYRMKESGTEPGEPLEYRPVTAMEAWRMLLGYYFLRVPFFDPEEPHGYWGGGPTAHDVRMGFRRGLLRELPSMLEYWEEIEELSETFDEPENYYRFN